jgi:hypothetical protein
MSLQLKPLVSVLPSKSNSATGELAYSSFPGRYERFPLYSQSPYRYDLAEHWRNVMKN